MNQKELLKLFQEKKLAEIGGYAPQEQSDLEKAQREEGDYQLAKALGGAADMLQAPTAWEILKGRDKPTNRFATQAESLKPMTSVKDVLAKYDALKSGAKKSAEQAELAIADAVGEEERAKRAADLEMAKFGRQQAWDIQKMGMEGQLKSQKEAQDIAKENQEKYVPGVGTALTKEDAKNLKDGKENLDAMKQGIAEIKRIRKESGYEMFPSDNARLAKQLATDLTLRVKNMAQLGQISASDAVILQNMIPEDPTSFRDPIPLFEQLEAMAEKSFENKMQSRLAKRESPQMSSEDQQALEWAQANPNDPRAKQIMQSLGGGSALAR